MNTSMNDQQILEAYRALKPEQPSSAADLAILQHAKKSVQPHRAPAWIWPLSAAAATVFCAGLFFQLAQLFPEPALAPVEMAPVAKKREPTPLPPTGHTVSAPEGTVVQESLVFSAAPAPASLRQSAEIAEASGQRQSEKPATRSLNLTVTESDTGVVRNHSYQYRIPSENVDATSQDGISNVAQVLSDTTQSDPVFAVVEDVELTTTNDFAADVQAGMADLSPGDTQAVIIADATPTADMENPQPGQRPSSGTAFSIDESVTAINEERSAGFTSSMPQHAMARQRLTEEGFIQRLSALMVKEDAAEFITIYQFMKEQYPNAELPQELLDWATENDLNLDPVKPSSSN